MDRCRVAISASTSVILINARAGGNSIQLEGPLRIFPSVSLIYTHLFECGGGKVDEELY